MRALRRDDKKFDLSAVRAGQRPGTKEVDDGVWLARFMRRDPGYFDL